MLVSAHELGTQDRRDVQALAKQPDHIKPVAAPEIGTTAAHFAICQVPSSGMPTRRSRTHQAIRAKTLTACSNSNARRTNSTRRHLRAC